MNKDTIFQSATNILMHIFDEDVQAIGIILSAQADYNVDIMCAYIGEVIDYLNRCKSNLQRYGKEED